MSNPRDNLEAKLGLSGPPLQKLRDAPPQIPDHELVRRIGQGAYGEVWLARNALGTWRAIKIVYRDNFKDARPYEREFAGIRRFEPLSRSNEGLVDVLQVGRSDPPRRDELCESPTSEPENCGGWFYYVMELADCVGNPKPERNPKETRSSKSEEASAVTAIQDPEFDFPSSFDIRHSSLYQPRTLARDLHQRGRLPLEDCLELGLTLTLALGHLHRHGLIHRDVKPSNIIYVGGVPKLADIGLVTEAQGANTFVGTEGFVPPEGPTSPQADLYALGKVLYEAAMGKDRHEFPEPFTQIGTDRESAALMELNAVLLRACAPDPRKRYATAEEMHADLALLHSGGSVKRRHQFDRQFQIAKQVGAAAIAATLLIGAALLWQRNQTQKMTRLAEEKSTLASENTRLATEAQQRELFARQNLYAADINLVQQALLANNMVQARALLQSHIPKEGQPDLRGFEWRYLWEQTRSEELFGLPAQTKSARALAFRPDGLGLATDGEHGTVTSWELASRREIGSLNVTGEVQSVSFLSQGDLLAIVTTESASLWDAHAMTPIRQLSDSGWFSTDGRYVLTCSRSPFGLSGTLVSSKLILRDTTSWREIATLELPESWKHPEMQRVGSWVAFSPDGQRLAVICADAIRIFSIPDFRETGVLTRRLNAGASSKPFVKFSPDNKTLATLDRTGFGVQLWDAEHQRELRILPSHSDLVLAVTFSPDGSRLATAGADQAIKLWTVATGELIRRFNGHAESLVFSPDGKLLASAGMTDGSVKLWDVNAKPRQEFFRDPIGPVGFSIDGKLVAFREDLKSVAVVPATLQADNGGLLVLTNSRAVVRRLDVIGLKHKEAVLGKERWFDPYLGSLASDGRTVGLLEPFEQVMDFRDLHDGKLLCSVEATRPWFAFEPRRQLVATDTTNGTTTVWHLPSGTLKWVFTNRVGPFQAIAFSPDEDHIVTNEGTQLRLWQIEGDIVKPLSSFNPRKDPGIGLAFAPDGRLLATGEAGGSITLWAMPSMQLVGVLTGHSMNVITLAFSPDGRTLASMCDDRTIRLWHVVTRREMLRFQTAKPDYYYFSLLFSPDGRALAARRVDDEGPITWVWHAPSMSEIAQLENRD